MSPIALVVLTSVLLLAMLGTVAGAWLEQRRQPSRPVWQNPALRDALLPVGGWCSLFVLDGLLTLLGVRQLPLGLKHLLGTLALLLLYYAVFSTLYLIYRSGMRIRAALAANKKPVTSWTIPYLSRLAFPTMFVSAALAALSVLYYDGLSQNLLFMACIVLVTAALTKGAI